MTAATLSVTEAFNGRRNILNALRLVLASLVIVQHAKVVITGSLTTSLAFGQLIGRVPVDGFFALSGFLIAGSWTADPRVRSFLLARAARLFPAFWLCLVVTVVVVAPVAHWVATGDLGVDFGLLDGVRYVFGNATLVMFDNSIGGTPTEPPYPGEWNASLWTLKWEFLCYLGVMVLGLTGCLMRRHVIVWLLVAAWVTQLGAALGSGVVPGVVQDGARFFLMYMVGVAMFVFADRIRINRQRAVLALVAVMALAAFVPGYRLLAAPLLAYGLVGIGILFSSPRLRLRNDISYGMYIYGFPVEQLLAHSSSMRDLGVWGLSAVTVVLTVPLALGSWFLVEKPTQEWAKRRRRRRAVPTGVDSS